MKKIKNKFVEAMTLEWRSFSAFLVSAIFVGIVFLLAHCVGMLVTLLVAAMGIACLDSSKVSLILFDAFIIAWFIAIWYQKTEKPLQKKLENMGWIRTEIDMDNFSVTFIKFFEDGILAKNETGSFGLIKVILFLKTRGNQIGVRMVPIIKNSTAYISQMEDGLTADELEIFSQYMRAITINHKFRKKEKNHDEKSPT